MLRDAHKITVLRPRQSKEPKPYLSNVPTDDQSKAVTQPEMGRLNNGSRIVLSRSVVRVVPPPV